MTHRYTTQEIMQALVREVERRCSHYCPDGYVDPIVVRAVNHEYADDLEAHLRSAIPKVGLDPETEAAVLDELAEAIAVFRREIDAMGLPLN
jgi:hypothetical protein